MKFMLAALVLSVFSTSEAHTFGNDSLLRDTLKPQAKNRVIKRVTTRLQSVGFFNFSGRICSNTPAADLSLLYEKNGFGTIVFSAVDLTDDHSENNFAFGIVYKRISLTKRFTVTPNFGVVMDGLGRSFNDRIFLISSFKVSPKLTIDETALFSNLLDPEDGKEWVNRVRVTYSQTNHVHFVMSTWHNNSIFDDTEYLSGAFQASYNRITISDHLQLQTAVTCFIMASSKVEVPKAEKNGLLLTIGLTFE